MITNIVKRDGRRKKFSITKIQNAITAAFNESGENYTDETIDTLVDAVVEKLNASGAKTTKVEDVQNEIETAIMTAGFTKTAKHFILYREERNRVRDTKSAIVKTIKEITESDIKSSNILRDNANESGATPAGAYGKIASETNKMYNLLNNINRKYAEEHKNGYMHIHDLNQYNLTFNCLFAPVGKLLQTGFDSGTGFLRSPTSIQTAAALTAVILQLQSNQQFGGIADDNIDFDLAPFVDKSFKKNLKTELERYVEYTGQRIAPVGQTIDDVLKDVSMNQPMSKLQRRFPAICIMKALEKTDDDTHQAMEGLIGNLNSLQSRSGNQVPFSSLNFGLDTSACGRMVSDNIIRSQMEGLGDGLTAIFPILIFKLMQGYTFNEGDPNYDLYNKAIKCLCRRFYPNFVGVDNSFNKAYIRYETKDIDLTGRQVTLKKRGSEETMELDLTIPTIFSKVEWEYEVSTGDYWEVVKAENGVLSVRKLIPNSTVSAMGCRTRVLGNVNGVEQTTGRGNLAFHTINLPRLAIEAHIKETDEEARKEFFFKRLDEILEDVKGSLIDRFILISKKTFENYPFTMQQGLYLTSDDTQHQITDTVAEILKQGTLSIGYVGLAETMTLLTGKTYGVDHDIDKLAFSVVKRIRDFCDKTQKETKLNWSCFATPAEATAGRFANIDKNKFKNEKKLKDVDLQRIFGKGYYTNSHMIDFSVPTSLQNKIAVEAPFHKITNAGHIFYYKMNGDLTQNPEAVKKVIDTMYDGDLGYFTITMDSDDCLECGYHGIINDGGCPKCGNKNEDKIVRVRRITGYLTGSPRKSITKSWNDGKLAELDDRQNI
jgi:ribonucleoside-triphosphate reductase